MNVRHAAIAFVASITATAVTVLAQQSTEPTVSPDKLRRVPPLPHPPLDGNVAEFGTPSDRPERRAARRVRGRSRGVRGIETAEGGLGPIFNNTSCATCHSAPVSGGAGTVTVTRFGRSVDGHFDPLARQGRPLLQQFAIAPGAQEFVPPEANVVAQRITTPLFGAGSPEAIPDDEIEQRHEAKRARRRERTRRGDHRRRDRAAADRRLGWKAQHASLLGFAAECRPQRDGRDEPVLS